MVFPAVMYECESWTKESWVPKNWCFWTVVLEKTLESSLECNEIQPVNPKGNQCWIFIGRTDAHWDSNTLGQLMRRTWERLKAGRERDYGGWDGWMASLTQWTWVCVNSGSRWWTERPGVLQSMGSQSRTRLSNWTQLNSFIYSLLRYKVCFKYFFGGGDTTLLPN